MPSTPSYPGSADSSGMIAAAIFSATESSMRTESRITASALTFLPSARVRSTCVALPLRRSAPPLVAAVDRKGFLTEMSVYNILPSDTVLPEYIAAVLNSPVMHHYVTRIRPISSQIANLSLLRLQDVKDFPIILPEKTTQHTVAILVNRVQMLQADFYTGAQRMKIQETIRLIDEKIADIYGITALRGTHTT